MNSLFPGIEDVEMDPPVLTLKFEKDCALPKEGEVVTDNKNYEMIVVSVDSETHSVKVVLKDRIPIKERHLSKREEFKCLLEDLALNLHKSFSDGMTSLLLWDDLSKKDKEKYLNYVLKMINLLEDRGFLKYGPHNI